MEKCTSLAAHKSASSKVVALQQWNWAGRLSAVMPSLRFQDLILSQRRVVYRLHNLAHEEAREWLVVSKACREAGNYSVAMDAVLNATALGSKKALIHHARLLYAQGQVRKCQCARCDDIVVVPSSAIRRTCVLVRVRLHAFVDPTVVANGGRG